MTFKYAMNTFVALAALISIGCEKPLTSKLASLVAPSPNEPAPEPTTVEEGKLPSSPPSVYDGESYFYQPGNYDSAQTIVADLSQSPVTNGKPGSLKSAITNGLKEVGGSSQKLKYLFESGLSVENAFTLPASFGYIVFQYGGRVGGHDRVVVKKFNPADNIFQDLYVGQDMPRIDFCPSCGTGEFLLRGMTPVGQPEKVLTKLDPVALSFESRAPAKLQVCTSASTCTPLVHYYTDQSGIGFLNGWYFSQYNYEKDSILVGGTWGNVFVKNEAGQTQSGMFVFDTWTGELSTLQLEARIYRNVCPEFGYVPYDYGDGDSGVNYECIRPRVPTYENVADMAPFLKAIRIERIGPARVGMKLVSSLVPPSSGDWSEPRAYHYRFTYKGKQTEWLSELPTGALSFKRSILDLPTMKVTRAYDDSPREDHDFISGDYNDYDFDWSRGSALPINYDDILISETTVEGRKTVVAYRRKKIRESDGFLGDANSDNDYRHLTEVWRIGFDAKVHTLSIQPSYKSNKVFIISAFDRDGENIAEIQSVNLTTGESIDPLREIDRLITSARIRVGGPSGNLMWMQGQYTVKDGSIVKIDPKTGTKTTLKYNTTNSGWPSYVAVRNGPSGYLLATGQFDAVNSAPCRHFFLINKKDGSIKCNPFVFTNDFFLVQDYDEGSPYGDPYFPTAALNSIILSEADNDLYVSGNFSKINGLPRNGFAKLDVLNEIVRPWTLSPYVLSPSVTLRYTAPYLNAAPVEIGGIVPSQYVTANFLDSTADSATFSGFIVDTQTGESFGQVAAFCYSADSRFRISERVLGCNDGTSLQVFDTAVNRIFTMLIPPSDYNPDNETGIYASTMTVQNGVVIVGFHIGSAHSTAKTLLGYRIEAGHLVKIKDWSSLVAKQGLLAGQSDSGNPSVSTVKVIGTNLVVYYERSSNPKVIPFSNLGL